MTAQPESFPLQDIPPDSDLRRRWISFRRHSNASNDSSIGASASVTQAPESVSDNGSQAPQASAPARRVTYYQKLFGRIGKKLPAQISRRHIRAISVGGAIGTGVFVGIGTSLRHAGPVGTLIAYMITGSVVWSVVVSIGEMISFIPNIGGPVGIASLYVDPALGFALGWNAWYNWAIILPTELSAAAILLTGLFPAHWDAETVTKGNYIGTSCLLFGAILVNSFGSRWYGRVEFFMSSVKIITMGSLIIMCIVLTITARRAEDSSISSFFGLWVEPGPFVQYRGIKGAAGRLLGVVTVMMQACFSFFGSDIPAVAAGEVKNPHKNIPKAVKRVWFRITLFYVLSAAVVGLVVRSNDCRLGPSPLGIVLSSTPTKEGSLIQFSNNVQCFLPTGRAPPSPKNQGASFIQTSPYIIALQDGTTSKIPPVILTIAFIASAWSAATSDIYISSRYLFYLAQCGQAPWSRLFRSLVVFRGVSVEGWSVKRSRTKSYVPWLSVAVSFLVGLLAFMASPSSSNAIAVFHWFSSMTAAASLLSWIGMMVTYIRWHQGTEYAASQDPTFKIKHKKHIYDNRKKLQPFVAWYALVMCTIIVLFNGWYLFTQRIEPWRIAAEPDDPQPQPDPDIGNFVPTFVSSFLPIPFFLLCILGYKLVYQSKMTELKDMPWTRGTANDVNEDEALVANDYPGGGWLRRFLDFLF